MSWLALPNLPHLPSLLGIHHLLVVAEARIIEVLPRTHSPTPVIVGLNDPLLAEQED